jgi:Tol biopolymer transport system component
MPRDRSARCGVLALIGTMSLILSNCGQGEDLAGPDPAALQVITQTSGTGTDPDGYTLSIDGRQPVPIALIDTLLESGVTPGEHTVDLGGISAGCTVQGGGSRTLIAAAGTTASADFAVICTAPEAPVGAMVVAVSTSGVDLDSDGYLVAIDPSIRLAVGSSDQVRIDGVAAGQQLVRLSGVAENCSVQGLNPITVDVPPGGEADTAFAVRCWPPPSGNIAFVSSSSLEVVTASGVPRVSLSAGSVSLPSWSPDGAFIALVSSESSVLVQRLSGGAAIELPGCLPSGNRPVWSPDGNRLLCLSEEGRLSSVQHDGSNSRFLSQQNGTRVISAYYLPDARIFLFAEVQGEGFVAFRVAADGTYLTRLFTLPGEDLTFSERTVVPSPDGQSVAYVLQSFQILGGSLYVANLDGTNARIVSSDIAVDEGTAPIWSPDDSRIAFLADISSLRPELWLVNPDGSNLIRAPLPDEPVFPGVGLPDWSPDGTRLAFHFTSSPEDGLLSSIYTIRADGSGLQRLTTSGDEKDPAWGP